MDTIESRLLTAIREGAPSAADHRFKYAVMARIERETFRRSAIWNAAATLAILILLVILAPTLELAFAMAKMNNLAMAVMAAAVPALLASFRAIRN
jgi:hypothetical protein